MIFANGYIAFKQESRPRYRDENGYWVVPEETVTEPIPCQWRHLTQDHRGRVQGEKFELATMEVIIPIDESIQPTEATITSDNEQRTEILRKEVQSIEHLRLVRKTRILL